MDPVVPGGLCTAADQVRVPLQRNKVNYESSIRIYEIRVYLGTPGRIRWVKRLVLKFYGQSDKLVSRRQTPLRVKMGFGGVWHEPQKKLSRPAATLDRNPCMRHAGWLLRVPFTPAGRIHARTISTRLSGSLAGRKPRQPRIPVDDLVSSESGQTQLPSRVQ